MSETILLLEDDRSLLRAVRGVLELEGYTVLACATVAEARRAVWEQTPGLMVLDVLLPDGNGVEFCREYRAAYGGGTPVLFLTALGQQQDILAGYEAGGADYLVKPFDLQILLLKIQALLASRAAADSIVVGPLRLDGRLRAAYLDGEDLLLTPKEYAVLEYLARNRSGYVKARELYEAVWGMEAQGERTVRQHIGELRKKMGGRQGVDILSQWGEGYRLVRKG